MFEDLSDPTVLLALAVVFIAAPVNWYVVWRLWRLRRRDPTNRVLRDRMYVAIALSLIVSIFALVFLNNEVIPPPIDLFGTRLLTRSAILGLSLPALYWLWIYRGR